MTTRETFDKALTYINREGLGSLVSWLENETDFFSAPASTNFHGNYEGGLLDHSINVVKFALHNFNLLVKNKPDLEHLRESVVLSALFHDVCKVNMYVKEPKWTKDSSNQWKQYFGWSVQDKFAFGHGEKSVYYISKHLELTQTEALAIRWHMGSFETSVHTPGSAQAYAFYQAIDNPIVRLIHCADMMALTVEKHIDLKTV